MAEQVHRQIEVWVWTKQDTYEFLLSGSGVDDPSGITHLVIEESYIDDIIGGLENIKEGQLGQRENHEEEWKVQNRTTSSGGIEQSDPSEGHDPTDS
jgi:hypothetical protein